MYSGNKIRKTPNKYLIIVCQNLIGLQSLNKSQFLIFFGVCIACFFIKKMLELVKPSSDSYYLRKSHLNFGKEI